MTFVIITVFHIFTGTVQIQNYALPITQIVMIVMTFGATTSQVFKIAHLGFSFCWP